MNEGDHSIVGVESNALKKLDKSIQEYQANFPFKPEINKKSINLKRNSSVGEILYEDAIKREEKLRTSRERSNERHNLNRSPKYSLKESDKFMAQRIEAEL